MHDPAPLRVLHSALMPQGLGLQGFKTSGIAACWGLHCKNGSPKKPGRQTQFGV